MGTYKDLVRIDPDKVAVSFVSATGVELTMWLRNEDLLRLFADLKADPRIGGR